MIVSELLIQTNHRSIKTLFCVVYDLNHSLVPFVLVLSSVVINLDLLLNFIYKYQLLALTLFLMELFTIKYSLHFFPIKNMPF